eukprot:m.416278 g.416278  ORF g.416278 m.416278 type:complete len:318 (+) comp20182_c3_seq7:114-1067(+)
MTEQAARALMRALCSQCAELAERYDQITQEENSQRRSLPCPNAFSALLTARAKALDSAALKTAMAYNTAPVSLEACQSLSGKLRDAVLAFSVASVEMDPAVFGQTFCCAVQRQAKAVLKTLVAFAETLATSPSGNNSAIPPAAGRVSEACKGIVLLPKDNKSAVCERLAASTALINDSVLELTQALDAGPEEEEMCVWSEQDRESLAPALGLLKASQHLSQKIHHCLSTKSSKCCSLEHLDAVGDSVCELSSRYAQHSTEAGLLLNNFPLALLLVIRSPGLVVSHSFSFPVACFLLHCSAHWATDCSTHVAFPARVH